jgi:hypothetical protein
MRIYCAPVSSFSQYVESLQSLYEVRTREGDTEPAENLLFKARGDTNRSFHYEKFHNSDYDAMWLADADMKFHPNNLECLRGHDKPIVTGLYFKRTSSKMMPIIALTQTGKMPYGRLHDIPDGGLWDEFDGAEIANCGFGNVLIKREVFDTVSKLLRPGEPMLALGPFPEVTDGSYGTLGADYLFFAMARKCGYKIYLDANEEAEAEHGTIFWTNRKLYKKLQDN